MPNQNKQQTVREMSKLIRLATVAAIGSSIVGCTRIEPGERGIETKFGAIVSRESIREGLAWFSPLGGDIVVYDIKNQTYELKTEQYTKDIQQAQIDIAITYCLDESKLIELHQKTGTGYVSKLITPSLLESVKDEIGKWEADKLINGRETATRNIRESLEKKLQPYGISITLVALTDISFTDVFEKAVEEKQVAMQAAIKERNNTERLREVANQEVVKAEADARAKVVQAEAEAKAIAVRAKAEAEAIRVRNEALAGSQTLIQYELSQRWDGKLPTTNLGTSAMPIINLSK